jgi:exopolysaccharide biosynthesis WecB/TagA/CpsF family protein
MNDHVYPNLAMIDGQAINLASMAQAVEAAMGFARLGRGFCLFTLNLDHLVKRRDDPRFYEAYRGANLVTADGAPVALLARRQHPQIERVTGADLLHPLTQACAHAKIPIALYGTTKDVLSKVAHSLQKDVPGLTIAHHESPPFGFDPTSDAARAAMARIAASGARLVFVALGAPKQEVLAAHWRHEFPQLGFVCIGAGLDFVAGAQVRAPVFMQKFGLEWLWRLLSDPQRLARRYARCALLFFPLLLRGRRAQTVSAA